MADDNPVVHIVDDDPAMRDSVAFLVSSLGYAVTSHASAEAFLTVWQPGQPGCVVADIRMPGMSGLDLQQELVRRSATLGMIFITGHGDIPMAVRAMRQGAVDFLEKPFDDQRLLDRINEAWRRSQEATRAAARHAERMARLDRLTVRERHVLALVVIGKSNKAIARDLDISIKTVEVHRHNVMEKLQAASVVDLAAWANELKGKPTPL